MEQIITKFQLIYTTLKQKKGGFYLFMILKMDDYINKWSIVISAPWITKGNQSESFDYIVNMIKVTLNSEESSSIARLGIFQPDEHLIRLVNQSIKVESETPIRLENTKLNGYLIHEAYIFESVLPKGIILKPLSSSEEK